MRYRKKPVEVEAEQLLFVVGAPTIEYVCRRWLHRGWWVKLQNRWERIQPRAWIVYEGFLDRIVDPIDFAATHEPVEEKVKPIDWKPAHVETGQREPAEEQPRLDTCPKCGGPADNGYDQCVSSEPYFCKNCMEDQT